MSFLGDSIADADAKARAEFVNDLQTVLSSLRARKPVDPDYRISGQTFPTVTKDFVAEEITALLDKYEEKPYEAMYDENGNFLAWHDSKKAKAFKHGGVKFTVHKLSLRIVRERGLHLP